jgi:hypothetical protein
MSRAILLADVLGMSLFGALEQWYEGGTDREQAAEISDAFCNGRMIGGNECD